MFDRIEFIFSEAIIALRRNTWMTFAAVSTAAMALFLLGGMAFAYYRLNTYIESLKQDYQIRVFLKEGLSKDDRNAARKSLMEIPGVKTVLFVSKEQGLKEFSRKNPNIDVSDLSADNPLPDVFQVTVDNLNNVPRIADQMKKAPYIESPEGVKASDDLRSFVEQVVRQSRVLGILLGGIMLITGGVLIYNAIRLTIVARRREIRIMELVGATPSMIRTPLLIEGMFHGILGGLLAFIFLYFTTNLISQLIQSLDALAAFNALPAGPALFLFLSSGALYGLLCSWIAARDLRSEA